MCRLMNTITEINDEESKKVFQESLKKTIQSTNVNFLIGSGCSLKAINLMGDIEKEIDEHYNNNEEKEAESLKYSFVKEYIDTSLDLINGKIEGEIKNTVDNYVKFLRIISGYLYERASNIHTKRINIFTTNYDMFIEKAYETGNSSFCFNDGFFRKPGISEKYFFSSSEFLKSVYQNTLFSHRVEIPTINYIKLHGSIGWAIEKEHVCYDLWRLQGLKRQYDDLSGKEDIEILQKYLENFQLVFPTNYKFQETTLNRIYYDLLRFYANELDKENTLLISEGFSFKDKHILDITKRALTNQTLKLIVFCYNKVEKVRMDEFFQMNNVEIVFSNNNELNFQEFLKILDIFGLNSKGTHSNNDSSEEAESA